MKRTVVAWLGCFVVAVCLSSSTPVMAIDFGPEEIVQAGGVEIQVLGYSVPSFVDWNNDQRKDLIVGEGGGSDDGKVRVYLNVGSEGEPQFEGFFYAQADGADLVCSAGGCMGCFPRVLDWDEDGRKDLLAGQSDGTIRVFLNVADDNEPAFDGGSLLKVGIEGMWTLDVGSRATPTPVDWNSDGMLDLVVGALDGAIHVYLNCGCEGTAPPTFYFSPMDGEFAQEDGRDLLVPGLRSSPVVVDFDGDGKKDLLTGNTDGLLLFYRNVGIESLPMFGGYALVTSLGEPIDLAGSPRSRPFVCHWTGDGYWDLLIGSGDGKIRLYQGIPAEGDFDLDGDLDLDDLRLFMDAWREPDPPLDSIADLNADGVLDAADLEAFVDLLLAANPSK